MRLYSLLKANFINSISVSFFLLSTNFIFSKVMDYEAFGEYSFLYSLYLVLLNFLPFGLGMAIVVYNNSDVNLYSEKISTYFIYIVPLNFFLLEIFILIFSEDIFTHSAFILMATLYSLFIAISNYFRVEQDFKRLYCFSLLTIFFFCFFQICSWFLYQKLALVFLLSSLVIFFSVVYGSIFLYKRSLLKPLSLSGLNLRAVYRYGGYIVLSSIFMSLMTISDKISLRWVMSEQDYGKYAQCSLVASTTLFLVNLYAASWGGFLIKTKDDLQMVFKNYELGLLKKFVFFPFICFFQLLLAYLFYDFDNKDFFSVLVLSLSFFVYGVSKFYCGFLNTKKRNDLVFVSALSSVFLFIAFFVAVNFVGYNYIFILFSILFMFVFFVMILRFFVVYKVFGSEYV